MTWAAVAIAGSAAVGAGASIYASNQAAGAQKNAAAKDRAFQQQVLGTNLTINEPNRALGYGATNLLGQLYGINVPGYTPLPQLLGGNYAGGTGAGGSNRYSDALIQVKGQKSKADYSGPLDINPLGGGKKGKFGGYIDPVAGTVTVDGGWDGANELLTNYLRTGQGDLKGHPRLGRIVKQIGELRNSGWQYDPNAAAEREAAANFNPASGQGPTDQLAWLQNTPGYQFARDEGTRDLGNKFAARGGAASGNALRALAEFNSGLAQNTFNSERGALLQMAGFGTQANAANQNALTNAGQQIGQSYTAQGDARASGVMGAANGVTGAINNGLNSWLMNKYLSGGGGGGYSTPYTWNPGPATLPGGGTINPNLPWITGG